jgi:hypothetical protein
LSNRTQLIINAFCAARMQTIYRSRTDCYTTVTSKTSHTLHVSRKNLLQSLQSNVWLADSRPFSYTLFTDCMGVVKCTHSSKCLDIHNNQENKQSRIHNRDFVSLPFICVSLTFVGFCSQTYDNNNSWMTLRNKT